MLPIQNLTSGTLALILRRQPASPARTSFAWQLAVGPALARTTTVTLNEGVLRVRASDERWGREIERASGIVLSRAPATARPRHVRAVRVEH